MGRKKENGNLVCEPICLLLTATNQLDCQIIYHRRSKQQQQKQNMNSINLFQFHYDKTNPICVMVASHFNCLLSFLLFSIFSTTKICSFICCCYLSFVWIYAIVFFAISRVNEFFRTKMPDDQKLTEN